MSFWLPPSFLPLHHLCQFSLDLFFGFPLWGLVTPEFDSQISYLSTMVLNVIAKIRTDFLALRRYGPSHHRKHNYIWWHLISVLDTETYYTLSSTGGYIQMIKCTLLIRHLQNPFSTKGLAFGCVLSCQVCLCWSDRVSLFSSWDVWNVCDNAHCSV